MPSGVASAKQLAIMENVLRCYCETYNVTDSLRREEIAVLILELFDRGLRADELLMAELISRRP